MDWMREGDRNTKFFHAVIKERRRKQVTQICLLDGETTTSALAVGAMTQDYFAELFSASPYHMEDSMFTQDLHTLDTIDNSEFCKIPNEEEIHTTIKSMNANGAPANDGYTGSFYITCWDIIKTDLCAFIRDFFQGAYIPKEISSTTLILLPKVEHARNMKDFRHISLCNFSGKIISKILANILPKIVDEEQAGFVQGRLIASHIVLA